MMRNTDKVKMQEKEILFSCTLGRSMNHYVTIESHGNISQKIKNRDTIKFCDTILGIYLKTTKH